MSSTFDQKDVEALAEIRKHHDYGSNCDLKDERCFLLSVVEEKEREIERQCKIIETETGKMEQEITSLTALVDQLEGALSKIHDDAEDLTLKDLYRITYEALTATEKWKEIDFNTERFEQ